MPKTNIEDQVKICPVCNRNFNNRKKWNTRNIWGQIVYCSKACQKNKNNLEYKKKFNK